MARVVITEQELEQKLLAACNRLRGPVDPTDYKAHIVPRGPTQIAADTTAGQQTIDRVAAR